MNPIRILHLSLTMTLWMVLSGVALPQQLPVPPLTEQQVAAQREAAKYERKAEESLLAKQAAAALEEARTSISLYNSAGMTGNHDLLARCLVALGRDKEAVEAYRYCFVWDEQAQDLVDQFDSGPDLAILLARMGEVDLAKQVYYATLRRSNSDDPFFAEPYPLVRVFDPSALADVAPYSLEEFSAACLIVRELKRPQQHKWDYAEEAERLAPNWIYPLLYLAGRDPSKAADYIGRARAIASTPSEFAIIDKFERGPRPLPEECSEVRNQISLLEDARLKLVKDHARFIAPAKSD